MVIHDNWETTTQDVYMAYGRNYSQIWLVTFEPGAYNGEDHN